MQAKQRVVHKRKAIERLENMNLGIPDSFTNEEAFSFRCYDVHDRRLDNVFVAPNSNRVCMFLQNSRITVGQSDKILGINGSNVGNLKNSRSRNRLGTQAKEHEKLSEDCHRQRVLRDRAVIEQREMMMRFGRNPGQNCCVADEMVSASPCEATTVSYTHLTLPTILLV